ncbi:dual specificity mitogen-activated protein kinase kinase 5-like [Corticium candelabrum]|uniref:dual specificity mitogen-activated protein kinase kinase 5-like n=1 Tax=Corticium candelabrum TaxID=121492 RepID=UPI002E256115|nr:dual specificity mitogen-activated protein kinase kinase 5-like [Corticium candelabrum]
MATFPFPMVLRIKCTECGGKEDVDWTVPKVVQFMDVIGVLNSLMPGTLPTAFDYMDEEGDRITVRGDDELFAMIDYYFFRCGEDGRSMHLEIFPKVAKMKNMFGLTVNTRAPMKESAAARGSGGSSGSDRRKTSDDLHAIVTSGQITPNELQYLELLGHGNGGTVYRAIHQPSKTIIAVKVIPVDVTVEVQRQIMSELDVLHQCHSQYIIGFYGAFFIENRISICTEFMDGGSLDAYGPIPEPVLGRIVVAVVKGLEYLWSLKIMHRDVKPSNVLVNTKGLVKLCDFGVSVQLVNSIAKTFVGTNAYMAPERILGGQYGVHSEVWSLGVTILEIALGYFPFRKSGSSPEGMLAIDLLQCIVSEEPPQLPSDEFSPACVDFLCQCMQKSTQSRPSLNMLMQHPFYVACDDNNIAVIATWICRSLEENRGRVSCSTGSPASARVSQTSASRRLSNSIRSLSPLRAPETVDRTNSRRDAWDVRTRSYCPSSMDVT